MRKISLKTMLVGVGAIAILPAVFSSYVRYLNVWGPAERTADMLAELRSDLPYVDGSSITLADIERQLDAPKYLFLKTHTVANAELRRNELIWFSPNAKYRIGLTTTGEIVWMVEGERH